MGAVLTGVCRSFLMLIGRDALFLAEEVASATGIRGRFGASLRRAPFFCMTFGCFQVAHVHFFSSRVCHVLCYYGYSYVEC